jgi:transcription elongation GreA/GreB family factor
MTRDTVILGVEIVKKHVSGGGIHMYDELTQVDIKKMLEEIDYRTKVLRPKLIAEVQAARAFGDLSENFEYKAAKQEKNRNDSRIRYLERMIKTARVITAKADGDAAGLFDWVELYFEEETRSRHKAGHVAAQNYLKGK